MTRPPLERRVSILEGKVDHLEKLPVRIDALELQIVQLRTEIRGECSAFREGIITGDAENRAEMRAGFEALHEKIIAGDAETRAEMRAGFETLRKEIVAGNEGTRRYMRVLFEDLIERSATIGSSAPRRPKR